MNRDDQKSVARFPDASVRAWRGGGGEVDILEYIIYSHILFGFIIARLANVDKWCEFELKKITWAKG